MNKRTTVSLAGFQRTVAAIAQVKKTLFADELNKQMLKVLVGAKGVKGLVQLSRKASAEEIRAEMARPVTYAIKGRGKAFTNRLSRVLAAQALHKKGGKITRGELDAMEQTIIKARVRSRAFIAASWLFSAFDLARHVPGSDLNRDSNVPMTTEARRPGKRASDADSDPARAGKDKVTVFNTADGAAKITGGMIPRALNNARKDMIKYLGRKFGEAVAKRRRDA